MRDPGLSRGKICLVRYFSGCIFWSVTPSWPLAVLGTLEITPHIAYKGKVADWACDVTTIPPYTTWWEVESGRVRVTTRDGTWQARPGDWILLPQGVQRRQIIKPGTVLTSLSFRAVWPSGCPVFVQRDPLVERTSPSPGREARHFCREIRRQNGPRKLPLQQQAFGMDGWMVLQAALFSFLGALLRQLSGLGIDMHPDSWGNARLDSVVGDLRRGLKIGPLPYAAWKKQWGVSRATLDRMALRLLGHSLRAHRDVLLKEELQRQFLHSSLSAKELSARYGFHDQAHFTRWVRRQTGKTPGGLKQRVL